MPTKFLGVTFPKSHDYGPESTAVHESITKQVEDKFPNQNNLIVSLTWFGPQFEDSVWYDICEYEQQNKTFDNLFLVTLVDPPYINPTDIHDIKNKVKALKLFLIGNFDSPHQFNFFSIVIAEKFKKYTDEELKLRGPIKTFVNYNRKPKPHRIKLVERIVAEQLDNYGTVTLGKDESNIHNQGIQTDLHLTIGETYEQYVNEGNKEGVWGFGLPQVYYSLSDLSIWQNTFLYVNAATEFNPFDDLFCQQDTFKPFIGMRPFVINGVQKTYRWLRVNGFKTFNHYWDHIDIENGDVTETIVDLIKYLSKKDEKEIFDMYNDMYDDLVYNKNRFFEFAEEQAYKKDNLF